MTLSKADSDGLKNLGEKIRVIHQIDVDGEELKENWKIFILSKNQVVKAPSLMETINKARQIILSSFLFGAWLLQGL